MAITARSYPETAFLLTLMSLALFAILYLATPRILARFGTAGCRACRNPARLHCSICCSHARGTRRILFNSISPSRSEADSFGLEAAREPDGFAMTAMQLSEYRKIEPSAVEEFLFFDHPSGRTRVRMAMDWKARHLAELPADQRAPMVMTSAPAK